MPHQPISHRLEGLTFSVLGDSISSFAGTIPEDHRPYYNNPRGHSGVDTAGQMWWAILAQAFAMRPLVLSTWSGSTVTPGVRDEAVYRPALDPRRCEALHRGSELPDIILIAMGVNDYSYGAPLGDWCGKSEPDGTTYRGAYAAMLGRIRSRYPAAFVACITPWFTQRGRDTGLSYTNSLGLTQEDYARATAEVASLLGCAVLDGSHIGFHRANYYAADGSRYCQDNPDHPTHPNARGQAVMGAAMVKALSAAFILKADL